MGTSAPAPVTETPTPCIARQPILTADEKVVGYELFFREGPAARRFKSDVESATSATIDALNTVGLDVLCDGHPAFINCTHHMLLTDEKTLLSPIYDLMIAREAGDWERQITNPTAAPRSS